MNSKRTLQLAVIAALMIGAAAWLSSGRRAQQELAPQAAALPGLAERINALDKVVITGGGNAVLATLVRGESEWTLEQRGYPADTGKLRALLLGLAEAKRIEAKTSSEALYDRLGVEDVAGKDAAGVKLELFGGGDPLAVILGQNTPRGSGTYLRPADEAQSWLVDRNIAVEKTTANWLQKDLIDLQPNRIAAVSIEHGKDRVEIVANADSEGDFTVANLPKGREPASDFVADGTAGLLQGLTLDDVAAASAQPVEGTVRTANFRTVEGLAVTVSSWQAAEKTWATFSASLDEAALAAWVDDQQAKVKAEWEAKAAAASAGAGENAPATDAGEPAKPTPKPAAADANAPLAVRDPAADREQRMQAVRDEQAVLAKRFADRVFVLPAYKAGNLNRDLEAYLKPKS